ncbi:MAG: UDP-N-acetylmuramoyl-L-alanine--D-glutamate ligase [Clostridia bacterium]|nr:UDP-N-acetylmuramoyl-L-alanine--D-glutamate ligase [Clostridia bacterium]
MYPSKQTFLVLGLSRSGRAVAELLLSMKATVYIYDDLTGERIEQTAVALQEKGARRIKKEHLEKAAELCDALVLSPGIPIDHPIAISFKRNGKAVLGEMEIAARYMCCPVIAVTGTNGKTTTVSMIEDVLKRAGYAANACGNIGTPMADFCHMPSDGIAVAEVSSFQLETLNSLRPHIAVVLNISEDHLNRHYNMENYIFLKSKLLKNSSETEFAVLNYDDLTVRGFAEKTKARVLYFSVKERVNGAFYENGNLYFGKESIMSVKDLAMVGLHNVQNALAVIAAAKIMGIKTEDIVSALSDFKGIKHRIETVATIGGVTYIDDSKGTNVDATIKAVQTMKAETVLLLGGKNKGYDYRKLFATLSNSKVVHAVLYGENRYALLKSARENDFQAVTVCDGFDFAVRVAALKGKEGQTVLLSPASASFDEFASYEERGDKFVEIVRTFADTEETEEDVAEEKGEEEDVPPETEFDNGRIVAKENTRSADGEDDKGVDCNDGINDGRSVGRFEGLDAETE